MTARNHSARRLLRRSANKRRKALVLVAALACLLIVMSLMGTMLQGALRTRRQLHAERDRRQAELLLQAGIERAARRMSTEPGYTGDTWDLSSDSIVARGTGRVTAMVSKSDNDQNASITVTAEYPLDRDFRVRRSRTYQVTASTTARQE
jgi:hypothetical protein